MIKILCIAIAIVFAGSFVASAQYENACRLKDGGQVYNGYKTTSSTTYNSGSSTSSHADASYKAKGLVSEGSVSAGGSMSNSSGSSTTRTKSECCYTNSYGQERCSPSYQSGHSDRAKNADNQSW